MRTLALAFAVTTFVLSSVILAGPSCAAAEVDMEARLLSDGNTIPDAEIAARVRAALIDDETAALLADQDPTERMIDVESQAGFVRLRGVVESEEGKRSVEQAAASVAGVKGVRSELRVHEGDLAIGAVVQDAVIAAKVREELESESDGGPGGIVAVAVRHGVVQLTGVVSSVEERHRAASVAKDIDGVQEVRNEILVRPR